MYYLFILNFQMESEKKKNTFTYICGPDHEAISENIKS